MSKKKKEFMKEIGAKGGNAVVEKYGKKYMSDLQKKRWEKIKKQKTPA